VPGLVGLAAALSWLENRTVQAICDHEQQLAAQMREGFQKIPGVTLYGPDESNSAVAVVSISIEGYDPQEAVAALDTTFGIQVRAGLHCAPAMHRAMGTIERGGTVRFSIGAFNTAEQIDAAIAAVASIATAS
jgi:selenocysteine lyase/cysteine desulfurase